MTPIVTFTFLLGWCAGLRCLTPPAIVAWAAHLGWIELGGTQLEWMSHPAALGVLTAMAAAELVADKFPGIGSRKKPGPFLTRISSGALCGYALCLGVGAAVLPGALAGAIGAVFGTLVGYELRSRLVRHLSLPDALVALVEDTIAVGGAYYLASRARII